MERRLYLWFVCVLPGAAASAAPMYHLTTLATFNGANGQFPHADLLADASGNLFGTTLRGGANGYGTVFEVAAGTHALSTLVTFGSANGAYYPHAGLIADASGNLYGTTAQGGAEATGANSGGTVFEVANDVNHTLSTLASFNYTNGAVPVAGLIADASGNIYGTTAYGGAGGLGTVFELAAGTHALTTLATFDGTNGGIPEAGLLADASGNLYGTANSTVFEVANDVNHTLTILVSFNGTNGANSRANLIADASGNLYGTTIGGGANNKGTVFELAAGTHTLSTLITFDVTNGWSPKAGLVADASGNLYGTTQFGGVAGFCCGTVFEVAALTHTLSTLVRFNGTNGRDPEAGLIADASGNLFGTTYSGGAYGSGTVFELSPVPEPSSLVLAAVGVLGLVMSRRRRELMKSPTRLNNLKGAPMNRFARRLSIVVAVAAFAILQKAQTTALAATVRTVALSGQQAPGTASGVNYSGFDYPVLNDAGQTAFFAYLTGSGVDGSNFIGIWSEGSGSLALVARAGSQAPGTPSGVNFRLNNSQRIPQLNNAGQIAFRADLTGSGVDGTNGRGIWSERSGSLALVARSGSQAPGTPSGVNYNDFYGVVLNNAGQTAFFAYLTGSGVDGSNFIGIWSEGSGSLALVARSGDHAPGTPSGVNYTRLVYSPVLNDAGQIAFDGWLTASGIFTINDGIWSEGSGSLALVARKGDHAPGTASGVNYNGMGLFGLNNAGQTAFVANLTGSGVNSTNDVGLWSEGSGSLALVAREGDHAPGTPSGVNFGDLNGLPALNNAGQIAFSAILTGSGVDSSNDQCVWSEGSAGLALVAREGSHARGTPSGVNFGGGSDFFNPLLNDAGQTAFYGLLAGSGVDNTNDIGIWATDRTGALQLIAREGDPLEVAPGDFRTISGSGNQLGGLEFALGLGDLGTSSGGRSSGFNNLGQVAFSATFTDGSRGVFVSNLVAIPEPATLALSAVGILGLMVFRKRRQSICGILLMSASAVFTDDARAVTISTVAVGNVGNANDPATGDLFGAVDYAYRVGRTEVTNAQYAEFLNAKAVSDPLDLYNTNMGIVANYGGITQSGSDGSYTYATIAGRGQMPVNYVNWYDSIRFANWLNNGKGSGDTETGAYTLGTLGAGGIPTDGLSINRNASATWVLPSENEWYKAAYHKSDGVTGNYFTYPTSSDTEPTADPPPGGSNSANYGFPVPDLTNVAAYTGTQSPYGAFDMGGNVYEWNEALIDWARGLRGGSFLNGVGVSWVLQSSTRDAGGDPTFELHDVGFRIASVAFVAGDYNGNGTVGPEDYDEWKTSFGSITLLAADGNGNHIIDAADFTVWRDHLGASLGSGSGAALPSAAPLSAGVPEPTTVGLLVVGMLAMASLRRASVS